MSLSQRYAEFQSEPGLVDTSYPLCKCGNLRHPLSEGHFCATCEVVGWEEELGYRMVYQAHHPNCIAAALLEVQKWQREAKEQP
jgi:hypothetical protein